MPIKIQSTAAMATLIQNRHEYLWSIPSSTQRAYESGSRGYDQDDEEGKIECIAAITLPLFTVDSPGIKIDWHGNGAPYACKEKFFANILCAKKPIPVKYIFGEIKKMAADDYYESNYFRRGIKRDFGSPIWAITYLTGICFARMFCAMKLARYLKKYRVSQTVFAMCVGVSQAAISRLAAELFTPSRRTMNAIYMATGGEVTPNDFIIGRRLPKRFSNRVRKKANAVR
jgi:hypothetical protein